MSASLFVERPGGGVDFGCLPKEAARIICRQPGPIRLLAEDLRHIEDRHGEQIRNAGYRSTVAFIESVVTEYNRVYSAKGGALGLLVHGKERERFAMVRLQPSIGHDEQDYYAVKTASLCRVGYLLNREPLLELDGPIQSSLENPFDPGTKADTASLGNISAKVNIDDTRAMGRTIADSARIDPSLLAAKPSGVEPRSHPPPVPGTSHRSDPQRLPTDLQEHTNMAAEFDHLFTYGPLDVLASRDGQAHGIHVVNRDSESSASFGREDPLYREILGIIEKNPHSKGFVANQIHARIEQEGKWQGPDRDAEGLSFGPSKMPEQRLEPEGSSEPEPAVAQPLAPELEKTAEPEPVAALNQEPEKTIEQEGPEPGKAIEAGKKVEQQARQADPLANWPGTGQKVPEPEPASAPGKPRFERKKPPEILFSNPKGKPYVLDHGDKITVTNRAMLGMGREAAEKRRQAVEVGLKAAVERFGEPVRMTGSRAFLEETVAVAMQKGIQMEPGSPLAKEIYERAMKEHGNQLGPSQSAPYRVPEKKKEVEKSKGLGLRL